MKKVNVSGTVISDGMQHMSMIEELRNEDQILSFNSNEENKLLQEFDDGLELLDDDIRATS